MRFSSLLALAVSLSCADSLTLPARRQSRVEPYTPYTTSCPAELIRPANCLNAKEKAYTEERNKEASRALSEWLTHAWGSSAAKSQHFPKLALALSGGGPKAGLTTAGSLYGLDGRETSDSPVKGLLQSMTYISALSGGSLTLSGIMSNDFAQVSAMRRMLWDKNYQNELVVGLDNRQAIMADVGNKTAAGYPATLVDTYGRSIAYTFIEGPPSGGDNLLWSNITNQPSFEKSDAPYPIITITQANVAAGVCEPPDDASIWEVAPLEFGSWDAKVNAFYPTEYLGTRGDSKAGTCTAGFDNTGFITAISSDILVSDANCTTGNNTASQLNQLAGVINAGLPTKSLVNPYGIIPNPFYRDSKAGIIRAQENLYGLDGGDSGQGIPIFPWLQPEREIDVIFAVDATSSLPNNITNGQAIFSTYTQAKNKGLTKMPVVPTGTEFTAQNLSSRAQFYGCFDRSVATIIYLPNTDLGNVSSSAFLYTPEQINSTIQGGLNMVTQSDDPEWAGCLACGIMHKSGSSLPDSCTKCLSKYCWIPENEEVCVGSYAVDHDGSLKEVPCA